MNTTDESLPELPVPAMPRSTLDPASDGMFGPLFTADQMRAYARAALQQGAQRRYATDQSPITIGEAVAMKQAAQPAQSQHPLLANPELTWLWTHCRAIGMTRKSYSGKLQDDVALFSVDLQERIKELEGTQSQQEPALCVSAEDLKRLRKRSEGDASIRAWLPPSTGGSEVALYAAPQAAQPVVAVPGWQPIETAPIAELEPFLVLRRGIVIQVSWFEGRLYPDAREACVDWDDGITDATQWMPLPAAPGKETP